MFLLLFLFLKTNFYGDLTEREILIVYDKLTDTMWDFLMFASIIDSRMTIELAFVLIMYAVMKCCQLLNDSRNDYFTEVQRLEPTNRVKIFFLSLILAMTSFVMVEMFYDKGIQTLNRQTVFLFFFLMLFFGSTLDITKQVLAVTYALKGFRWENYTLYVLTAKFIHSITCFTGMFLLIVSLIPEVPLTFLFYEFILGSKVFNLFKRTVVYMHFQRSLQNIEAVTFNEEDEEHTCMICRDVMTDAVKLKCGHMFHRECLQQWFSRSSDCPLCRTEIDFEISEDEEHDPVAQDWQIHEVN
ncbi:E3 ubiquitin protein ligase hrd-1 precursor, putative [Entamoeba invadens IP1]|uniref:E3 ubiquitin protein ligase hrd-1, putative n=1 Tax=Entamoeba invadens IP1 TaxID=370355 RepID=A0A0A1TWZ8_ENTIV|nr:E3 ubiquitin protein ligase hrd-1 precursor, putative [Entamoeba invadens IP1]ELP85815.1 E3 ubiquitin protein ligase hrd-1 precursor, putative [Entamoeba invadens IP1]|eukprot:XP_004185161.1 E3 ubiquitin protein ligase hrd-1 precursor, putative [Entamoeba invadens IP1]